MPTSPVLEPASPLAGAIVSLFWIVTAIAAVVFVLVAGLLTTLTLRYRARPGAADPGPTFGNPRLEIAWVVVPLVIVLTLFGLSLSTARSADPPRAGG